MPFKKKKSVSTPIMSYRNHDLKSIIFEFYFIGGDN